MCNLKPKHPASSCR